MRKVVFKNLGAGYLEKSLLKNGLFTDKIVPIFDGKAYGNYVLNTPAFVNNNTNQHYNVISHRIVSHKNSIRTYQIPHPHSYAILCREISKSWDKITEIIENNWQGKKINTLHVRKMSSHPECIFCMDYSSRTGEISDILLNNAIGKKYMVRADISTFFPSIYSHSITWVVVGRLQAFVNRKQSRLWYNKLDKAVINCQNKESVGLPIGPHTSNIISDLVLSSVDKKLIDQGYEFIRYIDDYHCFTESKERAEEFLILLSDELSKIRLYLNRSKTKIAELPHVFNSTWPNRIKNFNFSKKENSTLIFTDKNYKEILSFFDFVVELAKKEDKASVLRYAIKMLRKSQFSDKSFEVFEKYVQHLILLYPYLSDFVYDIYVSDDRYPTNTDFIEKLFGLALEKKLYASISRAIYACMLFNLRSNNIDDSIDTILATKDSVSITALMLYCKKYQIDINSIIDFAMSIVESGRTDEYWVLVYELFRENELNTTKLKKHHGYQSFKQLKDGNVSFINNSLISHD